MQEKSASMNIEQVICRGIILRITGRALGSYCRWYLL